MEFNVTVLQELPKDPTYTVEDLGTTYKFVLNSNDYYESNNKGVQSSYAICKLNIDAPQDCILYLDCINYAESNYDYGILSNLDSTLTSSNIADTTYKKSFKGSQRLVYRLLVMILLQDLILSILNILKIILQIAIMTPCNLKSDLNKNKLGEGFYYPSPNFIKV